MPAAVDMAVLSDRTTTIRASVSDVEFELGLAVVLVVLVIFLFLRNLPATIIPTLSVPLSLVGTLAVMYLLGFSLDNLSLMALTISTGFVVDDAIVMIENIARYVEDGEHAARSRPQGREQIGFTIISLTVSLIAVLIPLLFMGDVVGRLFNEFAVTLAVTIVISAVVSLTLVPMMCARCCGTARRRAATASTCRPSAGSTGSSRGYGRCADRRAGPPAADAAGRAVTVGATAVLYVVIPKGFFPVQDTGVIQGISVAARHLLRAPWPGISSTSPTSILKDPAVDSLSSFIGVDGTNTTLNSGRLLINLKPKADRRPHRDRDRPPPAAADRRRAGRPAVPCSRCRTSPSTPPSAARNTSSSWKTPTAGRSRMGAQARRSPGRHARPHRRRQRHAAARPRARHDDRPPYRRPLRHHPRHHRQRALRRVRPAHRLDPLHAVQPVPRHPAGRRPTLASLHEALGTIYLPSATSTTGQVPLGSHRHRRAEARPAADQPPRPVPRRHHLLQPRPGHLAGRRRCRDPSGRAGHRPARELHHRLPGRRSRPSRPPCPTSCCWSLAALVAVYVVLGVLYESFIHPLTILSTLPSAGVGALLALLDHRPRPRHHRASSASSC